MKKSVIQKLILVSLLSIVGISFTHCQQVVEQNTELQFGDGNNLVSGKAKQNSQEAFKNTVYKITRANCASCHASQLIQHANPDPIVAHDQVVENNKVNFDNPSKSRIVSKIKDENHGCWSDCADNSAEMLRAVEAWREVVRASDDNGGGGDDPGVEPCTPETIVYEESGVSSLDAFRDTVYPLTSTNCTTCHINRFPNHASDDVELAHNNALNGTSGGRPVIDMDNPANSALVRRIRARHNCGNATQCNNLANELEGLITDWKNMRRNDTRKTIRDVCKGESNVVNSNESILMTSSNDVILVPTQGILRNSFAINGGVIKSPSNEIFRSATSNAGGEARFNFVIPVGGNYEILVEAAGAGDSNNSFWVRVDNEEFFQWDVPVTEKLPMMKVRDDGNNVPKVWNLSAGSHSLIIKQREAQASFRNIRIRALNGQTSMPQTLSFDLSQDSGIPGATLVIDFAVFDQHSYEFSKPRLRNAEDLYVKDLKVYLNGIFGGQAATYTVIEKVAGANETEISPNSMLLEKDYGEDSDKIGIKFEYIKKAEP